MYDVTVIGAGVVGCMTARELSRWNLKVAVLEARRHYAWYLKGVPHASYYKQQLVQIENLKQLELIIREIRLELR